MSQQSKISSDLFQGLSEVVLEILSVEQIREIKEKTRYDLLAFVQAVQESLPEELRRYFHSDVISFDIEEPAISLLIIEAMKLIFKGMDDLAIVLLDKAKAYRYLARIERSHTRHAEPNTLGLVFMTNGVFFSPEVKDLLMSEGVEPELAYKIAQEAAFKAPSQSKSYLAI